MNKEDRVREQVSRAYAESVTRPKSSAGCCAGGGVPKGALANLAGYRAEELGALPVEAAANSFGCGNPVAMIEVRPGEVVLDLGSGAGIDLLLAAKQVGPTGRVIGVDMTDEMIAKARESIEAAGLTNVEVRKGLIEALPVEDASVDWVISNCVINLSPEKARVFAEIARVLKPGGKMLVADIVAEGLPAWIRENATAYASCVAGAISESEYLAGLRSAGLTDVEIRERQVYEGDQIQAFVGSDAPDGGAVATSCCGGALDPDLAQRLSSELEGKVVSAKIFARKP